MLVGALAPWGCATEGGGRAARSLFEQGQAAFAQREWDEAYSSLAKIRRLYPRSAESAKAFPLAAAVFKRNYTRDRYARPDSPWVSAEPRFMLEWFADFFPAQEFPQAPAEALFIGMHCGYFRDFIALQGERAQLQAWGVSAVDDNGVVESIEATRSEAAPSCV